MNHPTEEQLVFHYYGEGADAGRVSGGPSEPERREIDAHLASCPACRGEYQSLQRVLNIVDGAPVPDRRLDYGSKVWRALEPQLGGARGLNWRIWFYPRKMALAASMAALILISFLAGRWMAPVQTPQIAGGNPAGNVRERVLLVALGDHLERSQMVLVELVNARPGRQIDISDEQRWAEDLLGANRLYRQTASSNGEESLALVLEDLERVLVEIAHSPSTLSRGELREIRERIESQGILFKVRLLGSSMRNTGNLSVENF